MSEIPNLIDLQDGEEPLDGVGPWALVEIAPDGHTTAFTLHDRKTTRQAPPVTANADGDQAVLWARGWADMRGGVVYVRRFLH